MITRGRLFLKRLWAARRFGLFFTGTSRFHCPDAIRLGGKSLTLASPRERGLASDIVNVWFDDEYGLGSLRGISTIVDVGANIGLFTIMACDVFPDAVVHAYEPNPRVFTFLEANAMPFSAKCFNEAVGAHDGRVRMADPGESRLARVEASESGHLQRVSLARVLDRMNGHIDLLKLDCEGAEWEILRRRDVLQHVGVIRMEYHLVPGQHLNGLVEMTAEAGFRVELIVPNRSWGILWLAHA